MNFIIQRTIGWLISLIPFSGQRTYITAILGAIGGLYLMIFGGQVEAGTALFLLSVQAFFQRASTDQAKAEQVRRLEQIENELKVIAPSIADELLEKKRLAENAQGVELPEAERQT